MLATPTYEKEYSVGEGKLILKIWVPTPGEIMRVPTLQKGVSVPIAHPQKCVSLKIKSRTTSYHTFIPFIGQEIENYFCKDASWKEGNDFWEELKARELV
jgi:hypothetical protein